MSRLCLCHSGGGSARQPKQRLGVPIGVRRVPVWGWAGQTPPVQLEPGLKGVLGASPELPQLSTRTARVPRPETGRSSSSSSCCWEPSQLSPNTRPRSLTYRRTDTSDPPLYPVL
ncbi:hypothetical protein H8959_006954 [Pygathrix nigripes]